MGQPEVVFHQGMGEEIKVALEVPAEAITSLEEVVQWDLDR